MLNSTKIAYVYSINTMSSVSVHRKYREQYKAVKNLGVPIDFIVFTNGDSIFNNVEGINYISLKKRKNPILFYNFILDKLEQLNYDIVIIRHIPFTPLLYLMLKKRPYKVIFEHHTKEIQESLSNKNYMLSFVQKISSRFCFNNIDGLISVTDEIKYYEINRGFKNINNTITIGNGINVKETSFTRFAPFNGKDLNIIFIAAHLSEWHGLDRILKGLKDYNNQINVKLHLVGNIDKDYILMYKGDLNNIVFHGTKTGKELDEIFKNMNIGISSLALHRNDMNEGCVLKSREYLARGIPFIKAYKDPDLNENVPFFKTFSQNDNPIDINEIIEFVQYLNFKWDSYDLSEMMRNFAFKYVDWDVKMKQYFEFAKSIL